MFNGWLPSEILDRIICDYPESQYGMILQAIALELQAGKTLADLYRGLLWTNEGTVILPNAWLEGKALERES